ncbi:PAS domain-containing protein [Planococcus halocryophilus]|uniref:PAS domain-containing protein n=1 Tax=Planococcus halocryophilus TaxID=1215089 RepID=UPI00034605BE|nr:PAS domain S-box protein [Planococcus halocryophilus]
MQESEQRYQSLASNHPYGIFVFDENGHLQSGNIGTETITGYSAEELLETSFLSMIVANEIDKIKHHFYETLHKNRLERYEFACRHKNDQLLYLQATNIPIRLDGKLVGMHVVVTDITEMTYAKKSLNETKEKLEIFWENSAVPIFYIDANGDILKVNPAFEEMFEYTEEEMINKKGSIIPPGSKVDQMSILKGILQGETIKSHDTVRITKSGKLLNVISSYSPVRNEKKEIVGATIIYKNITELKRWEKSFRKAKKNIDSLPKAHWTLLR